MAPSKNTSSDLPMKLSMLQLLLDYLKNTSTLRLMFHMIYIGVVCMFLSCSYVVAFHWDSVVSIYTTSQTGSIGADSLRMSPDVDNDVNYKLQQLLTDQGGMRVYVYRYHDKLNSISGVPFFFQSNTHELIAPGAARLMSFEQRIPASIHIAMNNDFVKNQCVFIEDTTTDKNSQNYYFYTSRGAMSMARCPIFLNNGDLFGFVGIDWNHTMSEDKHSVDTLHNIAQDMGKIFSPKDQ